MIDLTAATVIVVVAAEREVMCVMSWSHHVLGSSWLYTSIASLIVTQTYVIAWKWKQAQDGSTSYSSSKSNIHINIFSKIFFSPNNYTNAYLV